MIENLEAEARGALNNVMALQKMPSEAKWFLNCLYRAFSPRLLAREKPEIILLGEDIPWELTKAAGARTRVILGGSLETTHWSDAMLPRDADPISRSACGWLMNPHFSLAENALVLTAMTSDSRRKMIGLMRDHGIRVMAVDLPPMWDRPAWQAAWVDGMARVARAIEDHTGKTVTRRALADAIMQRERVRIGVAAFKRASLRAQGALSPATRQLILESFWYTPNTDEWLMRLNGLTAVLNGQARRFAKPAEDCPRVLIAGSPVIFPNEKLPLLLEASGLALVDKVLRQLALVFLALVRQEISGEGLLANRQSLITGIGQHRGYGGGVPAGASGRGRDPSFFQGFDDHPWTVPFKVATVDGPDNGGLVLHNLRPILPLSVPKKV